MGPKWALWVLQGAQLHYAKIALSENCDGSKCIHTSPPWSYRLATFVEMPKKAMEIPWNILKKGHTWCWFFYRFGSPKIKLICKLHAFMVNLVKNDNFWCSTSIFDLVGALHENGLNIPWTDSTSNLCSKLNSQLITEFNMTGTYRWDFIHLWW